MKKNINIFLVFFFTIHTTVWATDGEGIFKTTCATCHTIGKGLLVGPDLKNVQERYAEDWLLKWIKSSQTLVKGGDETAVALFNKYNKVPMPDNTTLTDENIRSILAYIKLKGEEKQPDMAMPQETSASVAATNEISQDTKSLVNFSLYYILLGAVLAFFLLLVITLSRTIKSLSKELEQKYGYDNFNNF